MGFNDAPGSQKIDSPGKKDLAPYEERIKEWADAGLADSLSWYQANLNWANKFSSQESSHNEETRRTKREEAERLQERIALIQKEQKRRSDLLKAS